MSRRRPGDAPKATRSHGLQLAFCVDVQTKQMLARAAELERRTLTDFCLAALEEPARRIIGRHETLDLSEHDRQIFFETLINPARPNTRLKRAFKAERKRIAP
jgi:uncharacterized protein (DUF1778 family)